MLESRHPVWVFLVLVVIFGVVFTFGYLLGRSHKQQGGNHPALQGPKQGAGFRLLEEVGTDPRVYFLPAANRKYPAPGELKAAEKKS